MTPQDELLYYQEFAIALKEGPQGTNRQRADALRGGSITSLLWMLWAGGLSVAILLAKLGKLDRPAPKADRLEQASSWATHLCSDQCHTGLAPASRV